jgi:DNA-directed RNA polymerase specialized sigma24 family protein
VAWSLAQTKTLIGSVIQEEAPTTDILADLYDAHGTRLFRYALMILGDVSLAEDVVQESFVHVANALRGRRFTASARISVKMGEC